MAETQGIAGLLATWREVDEALDEVKIAQAVIHARHAQELAQYVEATAQLTAQQQQLRADLTAALTATNVLSYRDKGSGITASLRATEHAEIVDDAALFAVLNARGLVAECAKITYLKPNLIKTVAALGPLPGVTVSERYALVLRRA